MMVLNVDNYRAIHVDGCKDCPFLAYEDYSHKCALYSALSETIDDGTISAQHNLSKCTAWCPLRKGPFTILAEPGALA